SSRSDRAPHPDLPRIVDALRPPDVAGPGDACAAELAADLILGRERGEFVAHRWQQPQFAQAEPPHTDAILSVPHVIAKDAVDERPERRVEQVEQRPRPHAAACGIETERLTGEELLRFQDREDGRGIAERNAVLELRWRKVV